MTANVRHTMALLLSTWEDLPKGKADLQGYGDHELKMLKALSEEANTLRERCLEERRMRPSLNISGPVHEEIVREPIRQGQRDRN